MRSTTPTKAPLRSDGSERLGVVAVLVILGQEQNRLDTVGGSKDARPDAPKTLQPGKPVASITVRTVAQPSPTARNSPSTSSAMRATARNGSSYVASDLADWLDKQNIEHVRGAPYHPQTQGKIERWHQTLKNRILLENYYLPGDLERQVAAFVAHYNHTRYHESLDNLTPADVYFGRAEAILLERERIKRQTIANRRLQHQLHAA